MFKMLTKQDSLTLTAPANTDLISSRKGLKTQLVVFVGQSPLAFSQSFIHKPPHPSCQMPLCPGVTTTAQSDGSGCWARKKQEVVAHSIIANLISQITIKHMSFILSLRHTQTLFHWVSLSLFISLSDRIIRCGFLDNSIRDAFEVNIIRNLCFIE